MDKLVLCFVPLVAALGRAAQHERLTAAAPALAAAHTPRRPPARQHVVDSKQSAKQWETRFWTENNEGRNE